MNDSSSLYVTTVDHCIRSIRAFLCFVLRCSLFIFRTVSKRENKVGPELDAQRRRRVSERDVLPDDIHGQAVIGRVVGFNHARDDTGQVAFGARRRRGVCRERVAERDRSGRNIRVLV